MKSYFGRSDDFFDSFQNLLTFNYVHTILSRVSRPKNFLNTYHINDFENLRGFSGRKFRPETRRWPELGFAPTWSRHHKKSSAMFNFFFFFNSFFIIIKGYVFIKADTYVCPIYEFAINEFSKDILRRQQKLKKIAKPFFLRFGDFVSYFLWPSQKTSTFNMREN